MYSYIQFFLLDEKVLTTVQPIVDNMTTQQIIAYYKTGASLEQTRKQFNLPRSHVRNLLLENGILRNRGGQSDNHGRRIPAEIVEEAVNDYLSSSDSLKVVAQRHPLGYQTLHNGLREILGSDWERLVEQKKPPVIYANRAETIRVLLDTIEEYGFETIVELSRHTGLSTQVIRHRIKDGDIPPMKLHRCLVCTYPSDTLLCSDTCRKIRTKCTTYNTTPDILLDLPDVCEMCGDTEKIVVDHDHKTGHIRGSLCTKCNTGIGLLKDDPKILQAGINYLS